ncbi:MAG: hypothetical protein ABJB47_00240 [Actinomycetota bacterium]
MNIDRDQILELLRGLGQHEQADKAGHELPGTVDTTNDQHTGMLAKYGIDPSMLEKLGGLGKLL